MDESIVAYEMDSIIYGNSDDNKDNLKLESDDDDDNYDDEDNLEEECASDSDIDEPAPKRSRTKNNSKQSIVHSYGWTNVEKKNLYNALVTYGSSNLVELAKSVPTKSPKTIKEFIANYEKLARLSLKEGNAKIERKAPIDKWLEYLIKSSNTDGYRHMDFARAIKYIALFEPKTISADVKIGDCYEVISNLLRGDAPKYVNQESSLFLLKNIQKLVCLTKEAKHDNEKEFFNSLRPQKVIPKTYATKGKNADTSTAEDAFLLDEVINPLNVPKNLLFHH